MKPPVVGSIVISVSVALGLSGCAGTGGLGGSAGDSDPCNILVGAVIGGLAGALLDRDKRGRGALIGAATGAVACVAVNAVSRQTRTARQVEDDYRRTHQGQLPPNEPVVETYSTSLNPSNTVQSGERLRLLSSVTVVSGANEPVKQVKEVMTLTSPDGNTRTAEKIANEQPGSGAYENAFNLTLPKGVAPGAYPIRTQLYVNGKPLAERRHDLRVVAMNGVVRIVLDKTERSSL